MSDWPNPVTVEEMYGDWDFEAAVELLGRSLDPRSGMSLFDTVASLGIGEPDIVLDIGGRDARHALLMAARFGCRAVCVDPAQANIDDAHENVANHEHGDRVEVRLGTIESIPARQGEFDLVLSRDMMGHIADIDIALAECGRVLRAGGAMVIHEVFATSLLEPEELRRLCADVATYPDRLDAKGFETAAVAAGFEIESLDMIGSEWFEASQESGAAPNYLLQVARLRRDRERLIDELGETPYRVMHGNALWSIYHLIGKLESRVYVLRWKGT